MSQEHANVITFGPQTAAALGTVSGVRGRRVIIKVVTSGTETVSVTGNVAPGVISTGKIMFYNLATAAVHSDDDMDDGTFYLPDVCHVDTLVFLGSSTSDTKTVTVAVFD